MDGWMKWNGTLCSEHVSDRKNHFYGFIYKTQTGKYHVFGRFCSQKRAFGPFLRTKPPSKKISWWYLTYPEKGANIEAKTTKHETPLHLALQFGNTYG